MYTECKIKNTYNIMKYIFVYVAWILIIVLCKLRTESM
jgi:hypothetical protein